MQNKSKIGIAGFFEVYIWKLYYESHWRRRRFASYTRRCGCATRWWSRWKPLNPFKNGKQRALMESSKLDNQQKVILKCASKTNLWTISCAIKRKTKTYSGGAAQLAWQKVFLRCASQNDTILCGKNISQSLFRGASQNYTFLCGENTKTISRRLFWNAHPKTIFGPSVVQLRERL